MRLGLIEDLFQIRNNFWGLFNYQVIREAPVLYLVASMSWLVPLATIYPPAAMTIQTELVTAFVNINASTMNSTMTYGRAIAADANSLAYVDQAVMPASQSRRMMSYYRVLYMGASGPVKSLARFVMSSGQIVPMAPLGGENSSYMLTFYGPLLQCADFTLEKSLISTNPGIVGNDTVVTYNATWPETKNLTNQSVFTLTKTRVAGHLPAPRWAERNYYTTLQDSVFNTVRFGRNSSFRFDPHSVLNITEASINSLIANVTISALSLNTWYGDLNVSDSTSQSVYRFSHPINLFVPYALCPGLSLIVIALGLSALRLNGVSATDGVFLQVMMTTSRKTKMHQAAKQGSVGG
ncbi:hypothetical protein SVAN01_11870 [Stagonosporopsis vannaccii]|nr:hypothetical protein SVAN01_11870 [Stagonosporopsis vannaccii]